MDDNLLVERARALDLNRFAFHRQARKWIRDNRELISSNATAISNAISRFYGWPIVKVEVSDRRTRNRYGTAWRRRVKLYHLRDFPPAIDTLLHELAHCHAPPWSGHSVEWKLMFIKLIDWWNTKGRLDTPSIEDEARKALQEAGVI